jgi:hypothetical protein
MKRRIYVMNWADEGDIEAEQDDSRHHFQLETFASPQVCDVTDQLSEDWVDGHLSNIKEEVHDSFDLDGQGFAVDSSKLAWETDGWTEMPTGLGRSHQIWTLVLNHADLRRPLAKMVVQRVDY